MQIPVLVERLKSKTFRARGTEPFAISAKGATREEALAKLRAKIERRLMNGTEIVGMEFGNQPAADNPWLAMAGIYDPDDPVVQEWKKTMAAYRQETERNPD